jgi:hypothetical protein
MSTLTEETPPPKRQSLNKWAPAKGEKLRVFFPHDGPVKVMEATGDVRVGTPGPAGFEFLLKNERGIAEWVPGWYVASLAKPTV